MRKRAAADLNPAAAFSIEVIAKPLIFAGFLSPSYGVH
jgi:hypothetical protein